VSGIGPKTALALIGHMESHELQLAILKGNVAVICKVPGIGKKTAERLIIDMRDKVKDAEKLQTTASSSKKDSPSSLASDAIGALLHLGYNQLQAQKAIQEALSRSKNEPKLAELITLALRCI
jgi:Holliday junction DNA helicase RuvA